MFSSKVREKLKNYVYLYIDPRTGKPFYIGKGKNNRCFAHLKASKDSKKVAMLDELRQLGLNPQIEILKFGLTEEQALLVEATAIDLIGIDFLTNQARGHGSKHGARAPVEEIATGLDAREVKIQHPVILININKNYQPNMSIQEIYDVTRSSWKVNPDSHEADYALSIHRGIIREVFHITCWIEGGTTMRESDPEGRAHRRDGRWEFVGQLAEEKVRKKYLGRSVANYFKKGAQNPIMYINC